MDTNLTMAYDPGTDVVRVRLDGNPIGESLAVPLEDLTILLSPTLDGVIGINIQDLPTFAQRYISDALLPAAASGEALFDAARPHLMALMSLFVRNLGPIAKDKVAHWDEIVAEAVRNDYRT